MFRGLQPAKTRFRSHAAQGASLAAHLALLALIVFYNPRVIELSPAWLAYGDGAHTYKLVYFPPDPPNDATPLDAARFLLVFRKVSMVASVTSCLSPPTCRAEASRRRTCSSRQTPFVLRPRNA